MKSKSIIAVLTVVSLASVFAEGVVWSGGGRIDIKPEGTTPAPFVITGLNTSKEKAKVVSVVPSCVSCVTITSFTSTPVAAGRKLEIQGVVTSPRYGKKNTVLAITCDVGGVMVKSMFCVLSDAGPIPCVFTPPTLSWELGEVAAKSTTFQIDPKNFNVQDINIDGEGFAMQKTLGANGTYTVVVIPKDSSSPAKAAVQVAVKNLAIGGVDVFRCRAQVGPPPPPSSTTPQRMEPDPRSKVIENMSQEIKSLKERLEAVEGKKEGAAPPAPQ